MWLVVGAGLSGAVMAERIANVWKKKVLVIDKRNHIGGNCYDYIDDETGIRMNKYGAHLFHTEDKGVWDYINKFDKWIRWEHKVLSYVDDQFVPVPVNITTVNMLVDGANIKTQEEMHEWMHRNLIKYKEGEIKNSEQMALSRVGKELYEKMFKPYTIKQWNRDPSKLDASVLARIPMRDNFDVRYFADKYQALPAEGYTNFFKNLLDQDGIEVKLGVDFFDLVGDDCEYKLKDFEGVIYTGPVDHYFMNISKGDEVETAMEPLEYRSIDFKIEKLPGVMYYQPNSVVNYPGVEYDFTRIVEYKHFLNQKQPDGKTGTVIVSETTNDTGDPYYPVPNERNNALYKKYQEMAEKLEKQNIYFIGRLATYKYYNMDGAIRAALDLFDRLNQKI